MPEYRLGVRDGIQVDFDHVYSFTGNSMRVPNLNVNDLFYISIASVDSNGIMSPFTTEELDVSQSGTPPGTPASLKYGINCNRFGIHDWTGPDYSAEIQLFGQPP
ncbi:MAG: hypothetical protein U5L96_20975 [Owenweeksia sp.]|nr:hypothetical protein [Owenweeksia sp.]